MTATPSDPDLAHGIAINPVTNKIYLADYDGTLTVLDGATNAISTTTNPNGASYWAVAVNPVTNYVFVLNRDSGALDVYTGAIGSTPASYVESVSTGNNTYALAVNPETNTVYVCNDGSGTVTAVQFSGSSPSTTQISLAGGADLPTSVAVNPATNMVYVLDYNDGLVFVINGSTNTLATLPSGHPNPISVGSSPASLAINSVTNTIYVANQGSNNISVISGGTGLVTATVSDPSASQPVGIAVNPETNQIYVANMASSNTTIINGANNAVTDVPTSAGSSASTFGTSIAVDTTTNIAYIASTGSGSVTSVNGSTLATNTVTTQAFTWAVAVNPVTHKVYAAPLDFNDFGGTPTTFSVLANTTANVATPAYPQSRPWAVAVNPVTNTIFVADNESNTVSVIDGSTNTLDPASPITVGTNPNALVVDSINNLVYVSNSESSSVSVINGASLSSPPSTVTLANADVTPNLLAFNPVLNQVYGADTTDSLGFEFGGGTGNQTAFANGYFAGTTPVAIGANPAQGYNYAVLSGNSSIEVSDVHGGFGSPLACNGPTAADVNPVTNTIYVACGGGSGTLDAIQGADSFTPGSSTLITLTNSSSSPTTVVVNPVTNTIYVTDEPVEDVAYLYVVNASNSNSVTTINLGNDDCFSPSSLAVNTASNRIYVLCGGDDNEPGPQVVVFDGATNTEMGILPVGGNVNSLSNEIAANPVTGNIYSLAYQGGNPGALSVYTENILSNDSLTTAISLAANSNNSGTTTDVSSPVFTFTATNNFTTAPVTGVFFQVDTQQGNWTAAGPTTQVNIFTGTAANLAPGFHIMYAYSTDGEDASSANDGPYSTQGSPVTGAISAYGFLVAPPIATINATSSNNPMNFGTVPVGSASPSPNPILINTGGAASTLSYTITIGGADPGEFVVDPNQSSCDTNGGTLASNTACLIYVSFQPTANGPATATLTWTDNSLGVSNSTQVVYLAGTGGSTTVPMPTIGEEAANPSFITNPTFAWSDTDGNVTSYLCSLASGVTPPPASSDYSPCSSPTNPPNLQENTYYSYAIEAVDNQGNVSQPFVDTFEVIPSSVNLTIAGAGTGSVTSSPPGLNCSANCNVNFDGVEVTLTATPGPNSTFAGWSGATAGIPGNNCTGTGTCMLNTAYGPQPATATFTSNIVQYALSVTLSGTGTGTVTDGATLNCTETNGGAQTGTCSVNYNSGTQVTLTANPTAPSTFVIWGGACASFGTGNSCTVTMNSAQNVTAQFAAGPQGPMAYLTTGTQTFGTLSLTNGAFTQSGTTTANPSTLQLSGLGVSGGALYGGAYETGQLYQVNSANGSLTAIGPAADFNYRETGSTTSGVYAVDTNAKLYSVNVTTGNASLIGSTGLTLSPTAFTGLSAGSPTLYMTVSSTPSSPALLYSLNTITGAATLIGSTGVVDLGAMVFENGVLYAGSGSASGPWSIYSLNTSTGAATVVTTTSSGSFWGLAPLGVNIITLGTGTGTVTDSQNYIDCADAAGVQSGTCFADYSPGTQVTLTANTTIGTFGGWGGDCASANPSTTCSLTLSSSMTVIADFVAPPVVTPLTFQPSAIPETQQATFNCTTDPCTDTNGNALALTVQAVTSASPFTVYVIETEVSALQGNGLCPPDGSPSTFLPCRFVTFFGDGTDPNGNTIVPLSVPYANGNPVHYEVNSTGVLGGAEPNPSSYLGPVEWVITWNNDTFVPSSYWAGGTPQLYDDPDGLPAGTPGAIGTNCSQPMTNNITGEPETYSCQFEFNITTYYNPTEPIDSGIGGTTRQFNDVNVAYAPTSQGTGSVTQPPLTQTAPTITGACTAGTTCTLTNTTVGLTSGSAGSFIVSPAGFPPPTLSESGTLPPGMTLNTFTGVLGGVPTTPGSYPVTFTATNSVSSVQQMYTFSVTGITTTTTISSSPTVTYPAAGVVQVTVSSNSGTPTGNVTLSVDGATPLSEPLNGAGVATFTISGLSATTHSLSASYAAQGNYGASGPATGSLTVNPASTNISITSSPTITYPANGVVKVTVSSASVTPTGNVTLTLNSGSPLTAPLSSGVATFTIAGLNAATYTLSASYAAQGNFAASGPAAGSLTVSAASTSISISAPTVTYPANASIQVTVSSNGGTPTGSVSLTVNSGTPMSGTLSSGVATFTLTSPSPGTYNLSASYAAQGNFAASGLVTGTLTVNPAASTLKFTPSALNFGTVYVGQTTLQSLTITNSGTSMVTFTSFSIAAISGDDSTGFLGVEFCPKTLNPGKSCPIIMSFTADSNVTKTHAANLVIADNASGSPQMILMSATVINPIASLSPTSLSFGNQKTGTTSAAKPITLKNTGTTTLTLSGLSISGNFALATGTTCTKTTSLTAGGTCTMEVTFTPTSKGSKSGSITITDNAENSPQSIPLSGTGN